MGTYTCRKGGGMSHTKLIKTAYVFMMGQGDEGMALDTFEGMIVSEEPITYDRAQLLLKENDIEGQDIAGVVTKALVVTDNLLADTEKDIIIAQLHSKINQLETQLVTARQDTDCPHCEATEMLCGHNGPGCEKDPEK